MLNMLKGIIYKHTCVVTNKSYIGYTTKSMEDRWKEHIDMVNLGSKFYFHNAIRKYGSDNFTQKLKSPFPAVRLLENLTKLASSLNFDESDYYQKDTGLYKQGDWKGISYMLKLSGIEGPLIEAGYPIERLKRIEQSQTIRN